MFGTAAQGQVVGDSTRVSASARTQPSRTAQQQRETDAWEALPSLNKKAVRWQTQATAQYNGRFKGNGHWLFATLDYLHSTIRDDQSMADDFTKYTRLYDLLQLRADYCTPLAAATWLTVGTRSTLFWLDYNPRGTSEAWQQYRQGDASGKGMMPNVYASVQGRRTRWSWETGLRFKHNAITYTNHDTHITSKNIQNGWMPEAQVNWTFDLQRKHQLRFNAKHELYNVPYYAINSSIIWNGGNYYSAGNPHLKANKDYTAQLRLSLFSGKWTMSVSYNYDFDMINYVSEVSSDGVSIITRPYNADGHRQTIAWTGGCSLQPVKWWRTNNNIRLAWTKENARLGGINYDGWHHRMFFYSSNNITFSKQMGCTLNGNIEPTFTILNTTFHWVAQLQGSVYRNFGSHITASVSGNLLRRMRQADFRSASLLRHTANRTSEYGILLNLTWKFNGGKKVSYKTVNAQQQFQEMQETGK